MAWLSSIPVLRLDHSRSSVRAYWWIYWLTDSLANWLNKKALGKATMGLGLPLAFYAFLDLPNRDMTYSFPLSPPSQENMKWPFKSRRIYWLSSRVVLICIKWNNAYFACSSIWINGNPDYPQCPRQINGPNHLSSENVCWCSSTGIMAVQHPISHLSSFLPSPPSHTAML